MLEKIKFQITPLVCYNRSLTLNLNHRKKELFMNERKQGIINMLIAHGMWGIYPLYWRLLQSLSPTEILINRMIWSFATLLVVMIAFRLIKTLKETLSSLLADKKKFALVIFAAAMIGINWFTFTYAVVSDRLLEASLGYYINPILSILIGVIFLKEKLNKYQVTAVLIASIGVLFLTLSHGAFPWISLILAFTFGFYGLAKKLIGINPFFGLFLETALLLPISTFVFTSWLIDGTSAFLQPNTSHILLLIGAGFVTIGPLYFFSQAANKLPLKILGFLQYIGPTLQVLVAVFITGEAFGRERFITFGFIWIACLLFSTSHLFQKKANEKAHT